MLGNVRDDDSIYTKKITPFEEHKSKDRNNDAEMIFNNDNGDNDEYMTQKSG